MATFQEVRAQAQQGNTRAIAALLNYTLKKNNLQTKVTASGSCLTVYIRGQQAPDSSLVPRLKKSLDQLAIKRFEHLEVSAYQVGQAKAVWTSRAPLTPVTAPPAAPSTVRPIAVTPSTTAPSTTTPSKTSSSQAHQGPFTLLGRDLPENPWLKRIAGIIAIPLLIINSIQFMLLTQIQLFGLIKSGERWFDPQTNERINNIFMYFVYFGRGYLWYGTLILLGVLATRYAFHPRSQRANWVVLGLATIPTLLWLVGILTDPLLHFSEIHIVYPSSSSPPTFIHPTLGQSLTRWKKWVLIAFDLALMGGLVGLWIPQSLRLRRQTGTDDRSAEQPKGKQQRRATQVMAIVAVVVLLVTNPSHHQHAKSRALRDLAVNNPFQSNISREDMARYIEGQKKSTTYRSAFLFSWGLARHRRTFGILGQIYYYRLGVPSDRHPTRLDVFNPFSKFRQQQND